MPPVIDGKGEKYMNKLKLNLRMFEGEGAAAGETGEGAEAAAEPHRRGGSHTGNHQGRLQHA